MNANENIIVTVSEFLSNEIAEKIALIQWGEPQSWGIISWLYQGKTTTDCFNVYAQNANGDVVGRLFCLKNDTDKNLWYYGDLLVVPQYRHRHIAEKMLKAAEDKLLEKGCCTLRTYVEPENSISIALQNKKGFVQKPYTTFNELINDGDLMFEKQLYPYEAVSINPKDNIRNNARYVTDIINANSDTLHCGTITFGEWFKILSAADEDEVHFLICKKAIPCAYLKLNGLHNDDKTSWISMLAVHPAFHRQGIGEFAVKFAKQYLHNLGKSNVFIKTTADNISAQKLYEKCGFSICENVEYTNSDGVKRKGFVFSKMQ